MATISHTQSAVARGISKVEWTGLGQGDTGDVADLLAARHLTIQIDGNLSGTPTVNIQGSNDGSNWFNLADLAGSEVASGSGDIVEIQEHPLHFRPNVSSGDGDTDINVRAAIVHI